MVHCVNMKVKQFGAYRPLFFEHLISVNIHRYSIQFARHDSSKQAMHFGQVGLPENPKIIDR